MRFVFLICALLIALSSIAVAQLSWTEPLSPRVGDVTTVYYDPRPTGGLDPAITQCWLHWGIYHPENNSWSQPPQSIWPAGSHLHSDNVAVQSPMTEQGDSVWRVTIDFDTATHSFAYVFTNGSNQWDNNNNQNWIVEFVPSGTVSWWTPADPLPGDAVTIFYDAITGTIPNGATNLILHWGVNETGHGNWQAPPPEIRPPGTIMQGSAARTPMSFLGNGLFSLTIQTTDSIYSIHYVTTDGTNWDNNNNQNWDIFLDEPPPVYMTHVIFRYDPRGAFAGFTGQINALNLAGTFNGWNTGANPLANFDQYGNRWGEVLVPVGRNEYKFVINGSNWQTDPDNPLTAPGGFNNSLAVFELDSLPQIYDIQPGENRTYYQGQSVTVTLKVRGGDLGTGIAGTPQAFVNGSAHGATWNSGTGLLTLNPLPSMNLAYDTVRIAATDSAGRVGVHYLGYAFKQVGYAAADVTHDQHYDDPSNNFDLIRFSAVEGASGAELWMSIRYAGADPEETMTLITISGTNDSYGAVPGLGNELNVPGLSAGGVSLLLLDPSSPFFDAAIHNRLHPGGDLNAAGPPVTLSYDPGSHSYLATMSTAGLEDNLGSYQSAWYYTCSSYKAGGSDQGYSNEIQAAEGGVDGLEEPDAYDVIFYDAADIQTKLLNNYGLTRRVTLDAPGRGVAAIYPDSLGPHMRHAGPLCRILTRGAPTTDTTQTITGRVTSGVNVTSVWYTHNGVIRTQPLIGDSVRYSAILTEGANQFILWAVDANGDTSNSPAMIFTLNIDHAPNIRITTVVGDVTCIMDAGQTTDPEGQHISFQWSADPDNPAPVTLNGANSAAASFNPPAVDGEYYFNLVASDPDGHETRARTMFTIRGQDYDGFSNNEAADWAEHAMIYEIFVRSYSAQGNLDGVTADLERIAGLGVNCIWLMPIFEGPSDHGYEITDYYSIEQDYGTAEDLLELVTAAHARGIRVMLDMVINHTSINHPFMQDANRYGRYSHYWDWYDRDAAGNPTHYYDWTSLPNINLNNPECAQYWIDMCKYWIREFNIDGYRCDVAWGPMQRSPQFWVNWRQQLKEIKPEISLLAEAAANDFAIFDNRFDLAFDWNLHHETNASMNNWFPGVPGFTGLTNLVTNFGVPWPDYKNPLRFLENHDETRFISENTAPQTKCAAAFYLTIPGAHMIYAGQEIGMTSQRGQITWGSDPNQMNPHYYRILNARKLLPALRDGNFTPISNTQWGNVYTFSRYVSGADPVIVANNFSQSSQVPTLTIDLTALGLHADSSYYLNDLIGATSTVVTGQSLTQLTTSLSPYQSRLWVVSDSIIQTDVPPLTPLLPRQITLGQAYPNPFNPTTVLPLELNAPTFVKLKIYDLLGREVETLVNGLVDAGVHEIEWMAPQRTSGIYFAVMEAGNVHQVRKLVLLK